MPSFPVPVLSFLFVSFRPSQLRSHSRSTGASLLFRFRFSSGLSAHFLLSFVCFCSLLTTQPSALSFPLFPISPDSGSFGARPFLSSPSLSPSVSPVSMRLFRFRYSASCNFLSPPHCFVSQALHSCRPPVSSSAVPLCFRFRFRLLGLSVLNFSVRLRPRIYYHRSYNLSTPIFCLFQLLRCVLQPIHFNIRIAICP